MSGKFCDARLPNRYELCTRLPGHEGAHQMEFETARGWRAWIVWEAVPLSPTVVSPNQKAG